MAKKEDGSRRLARARKAFEKKDVAIAKEAHKSSSIKEQFEAGYHIGAKGKYLREFVYGSIDGTVTTFAVVSGATGATLSPGVVIILGFANLIADGFSMACSNFLSERAQTDLQKRERERETWEIEKVPEGEREEVRQIYKKMGLKGKKLENIVKIITSNKKVWVNTMMTYELGFNPNGKNPYKTAGVTFAGFVAIGLIPLLSYVLAYFSTFFRAHAFLLSIIFTAIALATVGSIKRYVTKKSLSKSVLETLFVGGGAAILAYYTGYFLRLIIGA
ncbi:hypothetical protein D6825_01660 [Candidatus Woesearchaeota archaeon]|nr:MAG: hypothetical protein D6825_01660 [Candidatus Woesearchaeota archaeon]